MSCAQRTSGGARFVRHLDADADVHTNKQWTANPRAGSSRLVQPKRAAGDGHGAVPVRITIKIRDDEFIGPHEIHARDDRPSHRGQRDGGVLAEWPAAECAPRLFVCKTR